MVGAFQALYQLGHVVVAQPRRQAESEGCDLERLPVRLPRSHEASAENPVHRLLKGSRPRPPHLLLKQTCDIVIQRQGCPHIMMILSKSSPCRML